MNSTAPASGWQDDAARWWNKQHLTVRAITTRLNHMRGWNLGEPEVRNALRAAGCGARSHLPVVLPTAREQAADVGARRKKEKQLAKQEKAADRRSEREGGDWEDHDLDVLILEETQDGIEDELAERWGIDLAERARAADDDVRSRARREYDIVQSDEYPLRNAPAVALELHVDRFQDALAVLDEARVGTTATLRTAAAHLAHSEPVLDAITWVVECSDRLEAAVADLDAVRDLAGDEPAEPTAAGGWAAKPVNERPSLYVSGIAYGFAAVGVNDPLTAITAALQEYYDGSPVPTLEAGTVVEMKSVVDGAAACAIVNAYHGFEEGDEGFHSSVEDFDRRAVIEVLDVDADTERAVVTFRYLAGHPVGCSDFDRLTLRTWRTGWDEHGRLTLR